MGRRGKLGLFVVCLVVLIAAHWADLRLQYFWDEAGYFVPAALDLYTTGDPIPHSVSPSPHPPLVAASLAAVWHLFGFRPPVTRLTMLCWAALALLAVYSLGEHLGGLRLGIAACVCVFLYPVFFAQCALAQLDLPAAAMTVWGIVFYLQRRFLPAALFLSAAVLCKESAIVAVAAVFLAEVVTRRSRALVILAVPALVLASWFLFVYARTGNLLGNPEFARYNVTAAFVPSRFLAALLHRLWDVGGHFFLLILTLPAAFCLLRRRGHWVPPAIAATVALYIVAFSLFGGAVLARYMLTAVILVIVVSIYLISQRWRYWWGLLPVTLAAFAVGLSIPPPYHYAYDENLAYRKFIDVHRQAAAVLSAERAPIITTWPATDELSKPFLGYTKTGQAVIALPDLSLDSIRNAADHCRGCAILFFPTQYEPSESMLRPGALLRRFEFWRSAQRQFETRPAGLTPEALAAAIHARIIWRLQSGPVYAAILR
jgi:hypothetical protein